MTIGGAVQILGSLGANNLTTGNATAVTRVGGDLIVGDMTRIQMGLGANDVYSSNVFISVPTATGPLEMDLGPIGGSDVTTVGGRMSITGTAKSDGVLLRGLQLEKSLAVNLGEASGLDPILNQPGNLFVISSSGGSTTTVMGDTTYTGGAGVDRFVAFKGGLCLGT